MTAEIGSSGDELDRGDPELVRIFKSVVETIVSSSNSPLAAASRLATAQVNISVELENVGRIKVDMRLDGSAPDVEPLIAPLSKADRVRKAKELLRANAVYPRGCSEFVCAVLGISYQQANDLMGTNPPSVGSGPTYPDLEPGDIAGWVSTTGSGHVAVYIGEGGNNVFIDVREPGAKPRSKNGYYDREMFKAPL